MRGRGRIGLALALCLIASSVVHYALSPWSFFPQRSLELKDTEGEITIPIEMLEGPEELAPPPPPAPAPAPIAEPKGTEGATRAAADAGSKANPDQGAPRDAGADAETLVDAGTLAGNAIVDAAVSDATGAPGRGGDAAAGLSDGTMAGPTLVEIRVNIAVVRTNPVGARMGPLLLGIPQWADFLGGTDVDPVKDLDWIWIFGPSLIHTEKDAAVLRYNMTDERAARNIAMLSRRDVGGGKFDAGVPGVPAWRGRADNAWRVFMLPRAHLAAMVPPDFAKAAASAFSRVEPRPPTGPREAVRVMVKNPSHPMPFLPTSLTELRFWVVPRQRDAGGADAFVEADAPDERAAAVAAKQIRQLIQQENSIGVRIVTRGILNDVEVTNEGAKVTGHLEVSQEQIEAIYDLVAAFLGVPASPSETGTGTGTAAPGQIKAPAPRGTASGAAQPRH